jgi:biopolymer transport protein ExbD
MARRSLPEINAGSMADIAFLLLIFFLVTTTMDVDTGLVRKLPAMPEDEEEIIDDSQIKARNIYVVLVNAKDQLLVEEELMDISQLREGASKFLDNWGKDPDLSDNPEKAIISLQNDRGTSYEMYIKVQNELSAAYRELRDREAQKKFGVNYAELRGERKKEIRKMYPEKISEAEPKNVGGN